MISNVRNSINNFIEYTKKIYYHINYKQILLIMMVFIAVYAVEKIAFINIILGLAAPPPNMQIQPQQLQPITNKPKPKTQKTQKSKTIK